MGLKRTAHAHRSHSILFGALCLAKPRLMMMGINPKDGQYWNVEKWALFGTRVSGYRGIGLISFWEPPSQRCRDVCCCCSQPRRLLFALLLLVCLCLPMNNKKTNNYGAQREGESVGVRALSWAQGEWKRRRGRGGGCCYVGRGFLRRCKATSTTVTFQEEKNLFGAFLFFFVPFLPFFVFLCR